MVGHGERELLRRLIDALPEELRQPLVLCAIEEMTSREVAVAMGIPEGTVRTRVMRARAELKRRFEAMRKNSRRGEGRKVRRRIGRASGSFDSAALAQDDGRLVGWRMR